MGVMRTICQNCKYAVRLAWNRKYVWCRVYKTWVKRMAQACKKFEPRPKEEAELVPFKVRW